MERVVATYIWDVLSGKENKKIVHFDLSTMSELRKKKSWIWELMDASH